MKNFRKVLALVLVVATLFSFVAMTASAKEYTDADKVSYTEAVDVLTAIGILNGYTDGTYRPTNTIARAEMAKMIAVLANAGKDNIGDLYASACKFADMTGDAVWAKSYVAYCNQIGIVAGRNATTFDPYGKVTGVETAKMLLCMIGFDAKAQGYVGTNWQVNVMRDAEKLGLLNGFAADYKIEKAITREEAAQMMLNALKAPMVVGTVSDSIVNISNAVWLKLVDLKDGTVTITLTDAVNVYNCFVLYGNVLVSNIPVWTNYAGLKVDADARDCYGNPVTKWSYTNAYGKETWSAEYAQAYDYYYTDTDSLKADLDKLGNFDDGIEYWIDGRAFYNVSTTDLYASVARDSGRGVEIKVYIQTTITPATNKTAPATIDNKVIVTVKNTFIGEVSSVSKAAGTFTVNGNTFSNAGYGFKEDDVILYWICDHDHDNVANDLHTAEIATPVNVDLTRTYVAAAGDHDSYIVGSGKTYYYAKNFGKYVTNLKDSILGETQNKLDGTFDLYLDKFGNIMAWAWVKDSVETGVAYLVEGTGVYDRNGATSGGDILYTATATTVDFDAKVTEKDAIDGDAFYELLDYETLSGKKHGVLISYTVEDGRKCLDETADLANAGVYLSKNGNLYDSTRQDANGNDVVLAYSDSNTKYLVRTYDYANHTFKYTAYNETNLPYNFCGSIAAMNDDKAGQTVVANIQYFDTTNTSGNDVLTYVFVNALYTNSTPVRAFVTGKAANISDDLYVDIIGQYTAYNAIIGGKEAILAVNSNDVDNVNSGYVLNEAKLTVIDLLDNNVPVYANVDDLTPDTDWLTTEAAWYFENGRIWLYNAAGTTDLKTAYTVGENFFAVVAFQNADKDGYEYEIITDPAELNDYVEVHNGVVTTVMPSGYSDVRSWMVADGLTANELYIVVNRV